MLSYRHGYHAGNHADVLKHAVYAFCLAYLTKKPKPLLLLDTHAGGGLYDLESAEARKTGEADAGVRRIVGRPDPPDLIAPYLALLESLNPDGLLSTYPGSPAIALAGTRAEDRVALYELHGTENSVLEQFVGARRNTSIVKGDGLEGLLALTPPRERRMLALIDPSYEIKTEYETVVQAVAKAWSKFPTGTYVLWRPVIERARVDAMAERLRRSGVKSVYDIELCMAPDAAGRGMTGSGLYVVNPPYTLPEAIDRAMRWLADALDAGGPTYAGWLVPPDRP
ncbi:MAG: 23S rRNA (adenine(2030)-N(6))-methyltransferase RlmJ [Pseudomonadota bacterium]